VIKLINQDYYYFCSKDIIKAGNYLFWKDDSFKKLFMLWQEVRECLN